MMKTGKLMLVALFIGMSSGGCGEGQRRDDARRAAVTIALLRTMEGIVSEYELQTNVVPLRGGIPGGLKSDDTIEQLVEELRRNSIAKSLLASLDAEAVADTDGDGFDEIIDGWGNPIAYWSGSGDANGGPSLPVRPSPYLASAGPDGEFGQAASDPTGPGAEDNIYSYEVDKAIARYGLKVGR